MLVNNAETQHLLPEEVCLLFGDAANNIAGNIVSSYHPETGLSPTLAYLKYRWRAAVTHVGKGRTIITGGGANHRAFASVELFDCKKRLSIPLASMNIARWGHGACAVCNAVVVCGGWDGYARLQSCEVYDPFDNRWRLLPPMTETRYDVAISSLNGGELFAMGGENEDGVSVSTVEGCCLPFDTSQAAPSIWQRLLHPFWRKFSPMLQARRGHSATSFQGKIVVAGGFTPVGLGTVSSVEIFLPPTVQNTRGQWHYLSANMTVGRGWFAVVVSTGGFYAFGNYSSPYNSVERLKVNTALDIVQQLSSASDRRFVIMTEWEPLPPVDTMNRLWRAVSIPKNIFPNIK